MRQKVISRIFGGLGNQLFCYAAARRLSIVNNAELIIDNVSGFVRDHKYKQQYQLDHFTIPCRKATSMERLEPFSRIRCYLKRRVNRYRPFEKRRYIEQEGNKFDERLLRVRATGTIYLEGYWQSEGYFKDIESTVRADLRIKQPTDPANLALAAYIQSRIAVAVHVRFFDLPGESGMHNAPRDYYNRALTYIETSIPAAHYFVFSDNPPAVRDYINLPDDRTTYVSHNRGDENAYADLWLMSLCQSFIIANSTFSWWGAWLSEHPEKQVVAPYFSICGRDRITSWGFEGLLPHSWIKL